MRKLLALLLILAGGPSLNARSLEGEIKRILAKSPIVRAGFAGVVVADEKGRTVVSINSGHLFTPASNTKLFSTALALERLGPDKRFETRVELRGKDLVLVGTGDANLSGRVLPYVPDSKPGPALAIIDDMADQIAAHGVKSIQGDILGDDTAFVYEPYATSWTIQDTVDGDGPPSSALVLNDNEALDPEAKDRSVGDPAQFAAQALKDALAKRGITVDGPARALHRTANDPLGIAPTGEVLARHLSLPLIEDIRLTNKISQNLHADLLLSDVAGSRTAGLQALSDFLSQIGIKPAEYRFYDGSGLSRSTLVSPDAVVALLRYMARSAHAEQWFATLPVAGVDGSLEHRLDTRRTKGRIRAKTGTLAHVSALSGYAEGPHEKVRTFSIFINNSVADAEERRELIDRICAVLVK
jgi:D-alanyl-D-alanine carboxypeptidase/D-alanyl-D-alanine-endopeptidase (penicillin-binding protein 4)